MGLISICMGGKCFPCHCMPRRSPQSAGDTGTILKAAQGSTFYPIGWKQLKSSHHITPPPPPPTLICRDDFNPLATFTSIPSLPNPHCPSTLRFLSIHLYLLHLSPKHSTLHSFLISLTKSVPGMMEQGQVPVKSGDTCSTLYGV